MTAVTLGKTLAAAAALACLAAPAAAQQEPLRSGAAVTLDQVSPSTRGADATADLNVPQEAPPARATLATSGAIPTRAEDRTLATAPIVGIDRCDLHADRPQAELCRRRLETRAADFNRPRATPVTPEGRLLLLTSPAAPAGTDVGAGLGTVSGLNDPNGPGQQLAGALQSQGTTPTGTTTAPLPGGVPPIVVLPTK